MFHIFHDWDYCYISINKKIIDDVKEVKVRKCHTCERVQGYSEELRKWHDIDFLETTSHDNMIWHNPCIRKILSNKTFSLYTRCHISA